MSVFSASYSGINLSASTPVSLWELKPSSDNDIWIKAWSVYFNGTSTTNEPVLVEFNRFNYPVVSGSTANVYDKDPYNSQYNTATLKYSITDEGGPGSLGGGEKYYIHPQRGISVRYATGDEWRVTASESMSYFRLRCTASNVVHAAFYIEWEE